MSPQGPRHWRVRVTDLKIIARGAIARFRMPGEITVVDGKVFPTRQLKVRPQSD